MAFPTGAVIARSVLVLRTKALQITDLPGFDRPRIVNILLHGVEHWLAPKGAHLHVSRAQAYLELELWQEAKEDDSVAALQRFLNRFGSTDLDSHGPRLGA